jgi:hypothetical protein
LARAPHRSTEDEQTKTILACGSREWRDSSAVHLVLMCEPHQQGWDEHRIRVLHGDARGADRMAAASAIQLGYDVVAFPADWETHGKRAGILRNLQMLDERPDLVVAFGDGRGTSHTVGEAEKRGIPVRRF